MRNAFAIPLLGLLVLAACGTPQERCISDASGPWRSAVQERERIAKDLARGYTYKTEFETRSRYVPCRTRGGFMSYCWDNDTQPVTRRVPVDKAALQARDAELARDIPSLRTNAQRDVAQCRALYPEEAEAPT
ncbi:excinuclease ABC subunit B [Salipiger sp. HF18]|nr:excinuclease ABC subunit B [Salipiger sp. HF18]